MRLHPGVRLKDALAQPDARLPAEAAQSADIEQFPGGAIGHGSVEFNGSGEPGNVRDQRREIGDTDVRPGADVHMRAAIAGGRPVVFSWQIHEVAARRRHVIDVHEFTPWPAAAPDLDGIVAGHRRLVQEHFGQVFAAPQSKETAKRSEDAPDLEAVWAGRLEPKEAAAELERAGYLDAEELASWLVGFRKGPVTRFLGERGSQQLNRLMPIAYFDRLGVPRLS